MNTVTSADGTAIAYDRAGTGESLVLVGGAFSYRRYPGQVKLAQLLSARFTVYSYDRRGRGDSGDSARYAVSREIEDLAAMIGAAGGNAHVWGLSSGAVLALEAADGGVPIRKLAIQEPPLVVDPADRQPPGNLHQHLSELIDAAAAARRSPHDGGWHGRPGVRPRHAASDSRRVEEAHRRRAHSALLHQAARRLPGRSLAASGPVGAVTMPTLVMCGAQKESPASLRHAAAAVAAALPGARLVEHRGLGHTKALNTKVIAAVLTEFLTSPGAARGSAAPAQNGEHYA